VRHRGIGQYLGRVLDAEAIETAGLTGAFLAANALVGVAVSTVILGQGAGGWAHALLFLVWTGGIAALSAVAYVRRQRWTETRFELTAHGVEQMVGHQTRLAQQDPGRRHDDEDRLVEEYVAARRALDQSTIAVELLRRGWTYAGLIALAGSVVSGAPSHLREADEGARRRCLRRVPARAGHRRQGPRGDTAARRARPQLLPRGPPQSGDPGGPIVDRSE
jgi:ATP-binding cassette subfamily B protein